MRKDIKKQNIQTFDRIPQEVISREIIDELEKKLKGKNISQYEIYVLEKNSLSLEVKDGTLELFKSSKEKGLSLRVIVNQSYGFSFTTNPVTSAIEGVIETALESAKHSTANQYNAFPAEFKKPDTLDIYDDTLQEIPVKTKIDKVKELENSAYKFDKRVTKVRQATYREVEQNTILKNSNGLDLKDRGTLFVCGLMSVAEEKGESEMGWADGFSRFYRDLDVKDVGIRSAEKAVELLGAQSIGTTSIPVLLDNFAAAEFLSVLAPSFMAESIHKRKSLIMGKRGKQVFSKAIHIIDDGLYQKGFASGLFDGEGSAQGKTSLVNEGVIENYLYDHFHAQIDGRVSTGNSTRSNVRVPPSMGITNFYIVPGQKSQKEIINSLSKALLVKDIIGLHTADPVSGDFSLGVTGSYIMNGSISHPVKRVAISGNLISILDKVEEVGSDLKFMNMIGSPSLLIAGGVSVSG